MKLTIDTKADTKEEIRKAIKLLIGLVGANEVYTNEITPPPEPQKIERQPDLFESTTPAVGNLMSMFDTPQEPTIQESTILPEEKEDEIPQIEFY